MSPAAAGPPVTLALSLATLDVRLPGTKVQVFLVNYGAAPGNFQTSLTASIRRLRA